MIKKGMYILGVKQKTVLPYQQIDIQIPNEMNYNPYQFNNLLAVFSEIPIEDSEKEKVEIVRTGGKQISEYGCLLKISGVRQFRSQQLFYRQERKEQNELVIYKCDAIARIKVRSIQKTEQHYVGDVEIILDKNLDNMSSQLKQKMHQMYQLFMEYYLNRDFKDDQKQFNFDQYQVNKLVYIIVQQLNLNYLEKLVILQINEIEKKLEKVIEMLRFKNEEQKVEKNMKDQLKRDMNKKMKESVIRRKMDELRKQLDDNDDDEDDEDLFNKKYQQKKQWIPMNVQKIINSQFKKLKQQSQNSSEKNVVQNYLEVLLDLPWDRKNEEKFDLKRTKQILDEQHYGLERVKERILEFLAVRYLNSLDQKQKNRSGSIICLVGPPGTGKTSLTKSIAESLNREFCRVSLGGVTDESEIRGHRRTYIGALPGTIVQNLRKQEYINSVVLLDEIDKLCDKRNSYKGDVQNSLLEILDYNQNSSFKDHYVEVAIDLSPILFVCTANDISGMSAPLKDRLEIIQIEGYTENEKVNIVNKHIIDKQLKINGLTNKAIKVEFSENGVKQIIRNYTREAGVRELERQIEKVSRKIALEYVRNQKDVKIKVGCDNVEHYLGKPKFRRQSETMIEQVKNVGTVLGLAYTNYGGEVLIVECDSSIISSKGSLNLTGNVEKTMKESITTAFSVIKLNFDMVDNHQKWDNLDVYLHFPEAAVPKDGPSAGITVFTAMVSSFYQKPIVDRLAMTGEITLNGKVLPVGGIKQKVLAAYQLGINKVIMSVQNQIDTDELSEEIKKKIKFVFVKDVYQVLKAAFDKLNYQFIIKHLRQRSRI